jgi:hypothetical protein
MNNRTSILSFPGSIVQPLPSLRRKFSLKALVILMLSLLLSLIVFSIIQFNAYIRETYLLSFYEQELEQLTAEDRVLEVNFSRVNSLNNINNYVQNFEKADKIEYLRVLESTVAAKPK